MKLEDFKLGDTVIYNGMSAKVTALIRRQDFDGIEMFLENGQVVTTSVDHERLERPKQKYWI